MSRTLIFLLAGMAVGFPRLVAGQCVFEQSEDQVLGYGIAVRLAVDPVTEEPVVIYETEADGIVYRHFYGPEWGREVRVDTRGISLPVGPDGVHQRALDLEMDSHGRPRVALLDHSGVYHTRYTSGWTDLETVLSWSLSDLGLGDTELRLEGDSQDRAHLLAWSNALDGGRRGYHAFDPGSGFESATEFDTGWRPHGATDSLGNLHVISFRSFADPENPSGLHQYQVTYWEWTPEEGWPDEYEIITDEPNPPDGSGTGPVGSMPEIAIGPGDVPHVAYPMHATSDASDGEVHCIELQEEGWSQPANLFPCNGHAGKPVIAVDHRGTALVMGLVYDKYHAADFGHGFEAHETWNSSRSHWQFHDLVETRGLFWHAFVPVYWSNGEPGDITVHTFTKTGLCPDVSTHDLDDDGADDEVDLCPGFPDPAQWDTDGDGVGDACDTDDDGDGIPDSEDVCPRLADPSQTDTDGDGLGDACSNLVDDDSDGWLAPYECDDNDPTAFPGNVEDCTDGVDNDCDGATDGDDPDCPPAGEDDDDDDDDDDMGDDGGTWESGCECRTDGHRRLPSLHGLALLLALVGLVIARRNPSPLG